MNYQIITCEVFTPEIEALKERLPRPPIVTVLKQRLHDYPEKLREGVQAEVDRIEREFPGVERICFGYGLCGRGLTGVHASRVTLAIPRVHDCIAVLLGEVGTFEEFSARSGGTYWLSAGWLKSFLIDFHLTDSRLRAYTEKFGSKRAQKLIDAENALLRDYKKTCHIRWDILGDAYVQKAKDVAAVVEKPYTEIRGHEKFLLALLSGAIEEDLFLHLAPGETIDMDTDGNVIAVPHDSV